MLSRFKNQLDIVAIFEAKLQKEKINQNFNLDGYTFIHSDSTTNAGSVGLYIKNKIKFELNQYSNYLLPNLEHLWIDIHAKKAPIVVGVVYRHPIATVSAVDNFKDSLNEILISLNNSKKQYYCFGDFNIDLMRMSANDSIWRYVDMLLSCACLNRIDLPTRISLTSKTLLDHIYTNDRKRQIVSGELTNDLSDHYATFAIVSAIQK